ncbi:hypothetical protein BLOT_008921 [Blomia tropicalis]|nr:hypothetical protein BLOT_008921 [Blomia tropicalis]
MGRDGLLKSLKSLYDDIPRWEQTVLNTHNMKQLIKTIFACTKSAKQKAFVLICVMPSLCAIISSV